MVREIITTAKSRLTLNLPKEMIGKTVEVIAFEINNKTKPENKAQRLKLIQELTKNSLTDMSNFKFNRDEANNYGE